MTVNGILLKRIICPTGFALAPKRLVTTVCPNRQTFADDLTSSSVNATPSCTCKVRMVRYSGETPCILVGQLLAPFMDWPEVLTSGEAAVISCTSCLILVTSFKVSDWILAAPKRAPPPPGPGWLLYGKTVITFVPIADKEVWILCLEPCPIDIIVITAATPIIIPSIVKNALSLLRCKALSAILIRFTIFIFYFFDLLSFA